MPINLNSLNNFQVVNNHVQLTANYLKTQKWCFKKITGTRFAAIFGLNKYNSPFKT
jgi:hypothetical protein